ncbi:MAG: extracellular solute-binding protein, partial [Anaerolineae bacterium]|nr:extracellular solute-binding protein [Anaerolineae bacterium]
MKHYGFWLIALLLLAASATPLFAQDVTLTVALPEWYENSLDESIFDDFEAENPGVQVVFKATQGANFASAVGAVDEHLQDVAEYAAQGDVLHVDLYSLSPEATRAGYFLDLSPLVAGDSTLAPEDFLPAAWQSFQWDRGIWGIPVSTDVLFLTYDPQAFDEAGLAYPNSAWTIDDLAAADSALSERDAEGNITKPGFFLSNAYFGLLARSLIGGALYDPLVIPGQPTFTAPEVQTVLDQWLNYRQDGLLGVFRPQSGFDFSAVPLRLEQSFGVFTLNEDQKREASLLPGGIAGLVVNGFGISAGTQYPEQAYALLKYMSNNLDMANAFFDYRPARESLMGVESEDAIALRGLLD